MRSRLSQLLVVWSLAGVIGAPRPTLGQEPSALAAVASIETALSEAIEKAEKSVVAISRIRKDAAAPRRFGDDPLGVNQRETDPASPDFIPHEFGAGVVLDRAGHILTSIHVLGEIASSKYTVWVQRRPYAAEVRAADPTLEVAVLKITAEDLTPIALGDAKHLKKGHLAIALGNPLGIARHGEASAAWGIIANLERQAPANPTARAHKGRETLHHYGTLIQLDTKLPLGSSGGALVNLRGEMIGLTTTYTGLPGQDKEAGFAIPVDEDFKKAVDTLKSGRLPEYGFLGIATQALADSRAAVRGAVVEDVVPGTPAASAGLRSGDVITRVGESVVRDDLHLIRLVSALPAETKVTLQVARDPRSTKTIAVPVVLSKKYQESTREAFAAERDPGWRGLRVEFATASPQFRELARHVDPQGCVAVVEVDRDSPAWKAGLRSGVFVSHVNEKRVATPRQFHAEAESKSGEVALRTTLVGDGDPVKKVASP